MILEEIKAMRFMGKLKGKIQMVCECEKLTMSDGTIVHILPSKAYADVCKGIAKLKAIDSDGDAVWLCDDCLAHA